MGLTGKQVKGSFEKDGSVERVMEAVRRWQSPLGASQVQTIFRRAFWQAVHVGTQWVKRALDVSVASFFFILLLPLGLMVAFLIRLESKGPVFFKQIRVGKYGRTFAMWKFRSMYIDADARREALKDEQSEDEQRISGGIRFKMKRDPRITRVGRLIRKASIDELPQLWNVIKGHMSLVGPRPPIPKEVAEYTLSDRRRLDVIPGITCIWQVSGRSDIPFDRQVEMDVDYIETQSIRSDLLLMLRTVPAVLFGRGAY